MKPPPPPSAENLLQNRRLQRPLHPVSAIGDGSGSGSSGVARGKAFGDGVDGGDGGGGFARARGGGGSEVVEDRLWPDKHRPRDVSGLAVHSKKVCNCV